MNNTQDNRQSVYRLWAIGLGVTIVVVTICGSLGLVWMRQQVSAAATSVSRLQTQIVEAERESAGLDARLARALSPGNLAASLPEGLRPSSGEQIVWSVRARPLAPAQGFEDTTLVAAAEPARQPARAGSLVARQSAPVAPGTGTQSRSHLVSVSQPGAAPVAETPLTVTFDYPAQRGVQPRQGATARR